MHPKAFTARTHLAPVILGLLGLLAHSHSFAETVFISTNHGEIAIELFKDKAPRTVENFLKYVRQGFYNQTVFHRVIPNFMIQGGGYDKYYKYKKPDKPITNEANNGLSNIRGSIAMARTEEKDSATSQFFINLVNNPFLDHGSRGYGYAVFGRVTKGLDVVDKIGKVETMKHRGMNNAPKEPVLIIRAWVEGD